MHLKPMVTNPSKSLPLIHAGLVSYEDQMGSLLVRYRVEVDGLHRKLRSGWSESY